MGDVDPGEGTLLGLGWDVWAQGEWDRCDPPSGSLPGRVVRADQGRCLVGTEQGLQHPGTRGAPTHPAVGDWVAVDRDGGRIVETLPRRSALTRSKEGGVEQVLAANVDWVGLVVRVDRDFNARRLERLLLIAWESSAQPLVLLSKADLLGPAELAERVVEGEAVAFGVPVIPISVVSGEGLDDLRKVWRPRQTAVVIGESGAGKSSLVNAFAAGEVQRTRGVRGSDGKGRHTTVARELFVVDGGRIVIDTPGVRAVGVAGSAEAVTSTFPDVAELAAGCRYADCVHLREPACAVKDAVEAGVLDRGRLEGFHRLRREAAHEVRKQEPAVRHKDREWGRLGKEAARIKRQAATRRPPR
jgi:ribosome biogenesis GTPase / thiamine phosphate phosphatase